MAGLPGQFAANSQITRHSYKTRNGLHGPEVRLWEVDLNGPENVPLTNIIGNYKSVSHS